MNCLVPLEEFGAAAESSTIVQALLQQQQSPTLFSQAEHQFCCWPSLVNIGCNSSAVMLCSSRLTPGMLVAHSMRSIFSSVLYIVLLLWPTAL